MTNTRGIIAHSSVVTRDSECIALIMTASCDLEVRNKSIECLSDDPQQIVGGQCW